MTTFDLHSFQILLKVLFPCISVDYYDIDTKAFLLKTMIVLHITKRNK